MSKKQREKVEEEVNFHQTQNRMRGSSGSGTSPDPWQGPDTTSTGETCVYPPSFPPYPSDLGQASYTTPAAPNQNPFPSYGQQQQQQQQQQAGAGTGQFSDYDVDSTTPNTTFDNRNGGGGMQDQDNTLLQPGKHKEIWKIFYWCWCKIISQEWKDCRWDSSSRWCHLTPEQGQWLVSSRRPGWSSLPLMAGSQTPPPADPLLQESPSLTSQTMDTCKMSRTVSLVTTNKYFLSFMNLKSNTQYFLLAKLNYLP